MIAARATQGRGLGARFAIMLHAFGFGPLGLDRIYVGIVPANVTPWVTAWSLAAIDADGSYVGDTATGTVTVGRIVVERPGGEHREEVDPPL